ncbi:MAG: hydrogenase formation protein HypD [Pseudomonadota bacterium]|jgi:hydrogenase expression/formation protein HypD
MSLTAAQWLEQLQALSFSKPFKIMNVCGGHERSITHAGLRGMLPPAFELIPGPGCPVCICPEEDIFTAIQWATHEKIILVAFGDMLRVPVNVPKNQPRSLEQAKASGADIRPIASPQEAVSIARHNPSTTVVFFAAGFETTIAPVASMLVEGVPSNLLILLSGRLTYPAVKMLLETEQAAFDALIAPGHVAAVMGAEEWEFVATRHQMPVAVAGFSAESLLAGFYSVARQFQTHRIALDNCYPQVVHQNGNPTAKQQLKQAFEIIDATWRGIGIIPQSGFELRETFAHHNARLKLPTYDEVSRRRMGEMPAGCDCAKVVLGQLYPNQCKLFGKSCVPRAPIGPCMVSDEGACRIWWAAGLRNPQP